MRDYYNKNSKEYINKTMNCDIKNIYAFFELHINSSHKTLLDLGFGSSRDSLYFKNNFVVTSIDKSYKFVRNAKKLDLNAHKLKIEKMNYKESFDLIWANASLLHIKEERLNDSFIRCANALKVGGVMYASFKYGDFSGIRDDRYYIDLTEKSILKYLSNTNLKMIDYLITEDNLSKRDIKWLNVILVKESL